LESVLEQNGDFAEIKDVISRYDTLAATNSELMERSRVAQEKTEELRQSLLSSSKELFDNIGAKQHFA
jgi:hypothetical protein